jgi:hypothetical protein
MKTTNLILAGLTLIGSAFISMPKAEAHHCSRFDLTCSPSHRGNCTLSGGNCSSGGGEAETQVMTPPTYYSFELRNSTNHPMSFTINGTQYILQPGARSPYRYQRTSGSSSGGSTGTHYSTTISWDGDYAPGVQIRNFTLPFSNFDSWYEFRSDSRTIILY